MKKNLYIIIACCIAAAAFSCKPAKKAQKVQQQIERQDTAKIVIVRPETKSDELDTLKQTLKELDSFKIAGFGTFSGKASVNYDDGNNSQNATINIHMKEDSVIWISITGMLGIEGYRAKITKDSVLVMDKLHHTIMRRDLSYIQNLMNAPFTFNDIQNILLGNPFFMNGNITSYKSTRNQWFVTLYGSEIRNFITILDNNKKLYIKHSRLQDSVANNNRVCDITFGGHQAYNNFWFSQNRIIQVSDSKNNVNIKMQFKDKEIHFGDDVDFPFNIPSSYTEK